MCCSVNGFVCLVCCVFDSVCDLFSETICNIFGWGCYFVGGCYGSLVCVEVKVLCCMYRLWSSKECACCACDPSVHLSVPSIGFVLYVGSYLQGLEGWDCVISV